MGYIKPKIYMTNLLGDLHREINHPVYKMALRVADSTLREIYQLALKRGDKELENMLTPLCYDKKQEPIH